jgi:hypothetical protein
MSEQQSEQQLRAELDAVYRSTSWKVTAPLRVLNAALRRVLPSVSPVLAQEKACAAMTESIDASAAQLQQVSATPESQVENDLADNAELTELSGIDLSPSAQLIFAELNTLIEKQTYAHRP